VTLVVDTNVILVANHQHEGVSEVCVAACAKRLLDLTRSGRIAIDDSYRILREYQQKTQPHVGKRPGDAFVKWVLRNNANKERCDQVSLAGHSEREFEAFPDDDRLTNFDPPDRKFVAVAAAHQHRPPILQATDSKWVAWVPALAEHQIAVELLCPADIAKFHKKKTRP